MDLPPAAVGEAQPMVFGQTPNIWTCLPPAADGTVSMRKIPPLANYVSRLGPRVPAFVISPYVPRGWDGKVSESGFLFSRMVRGVKQVAAIDGAHDALAPRHRAQVATPMKLCVSTRPIKPPAQSTRRPVVTR